MTSAWKPVYARGEESHTGTDNVWQLLPMTLFSALSPIFLLKLGCVSWYMVTGEKQDSPETDWHLNQNTHAWLEASAFIRGTKGMKNCWAMSQN